MTREQKLEETARALIDQLRRHLPTEDYAYFEPVILDVAESLAEPTETPRLSPELQRKAQLAAKAFENAPPDSPATDDFDPDYGLTPTETPRPIEPIAKPICGASVGDGVAHKELGWCSLPDMHEGRCVPVPTETPRPPTLSGEHARALKALLAALDDGVDLYNVVLHARHVLDAPTEPEAGCCRRLREQFAKFGAEWAMIAVGDMEAEEFAEAIRSLPFPEQRAPEPEGK